MKAEALPPEPPLSRRIRIVFVCNSSFGLDTLYRGLFPHLRSRGFDCEVVVGDDEFLHGQPDFADTPIHVVPMRRQPSPWRDLVSMARFIAFFATHRYDVVHVSTPKAALLGAVAARITAQTRILFVVRTRIYENRDGVSRWVYQQIDRLICQLSTLVAPVGREMGEQMVAQSLCPAEIIRHFGEGSSNGVNTARFNRTVAASEAGRALRARAGIPEDATVLLYVGRLARDKGLHHLGTVLDRMPPGTWLLIVGPPDSREPTDTKVLEALDRRPNVARLGYQSDPIAAYAAADIFLFPSQREGFSNSTLEAQAMGLPVIGFDISGVRGPVRHGETGLLAPLDNAETLAEFTLRLVVDPDERRTMGKAAVNHIRAHFTNEVVWRDLERTLVELAGG